MTGDRKNNLHTNSRIINLAKQKAKESIGRLFNKDELDILFHHYSTLFVCMCLATA